MSSYVRFIGLRYLMAKKRGCVLSIITIISILGVALGVTALIVVLSVMGGFKKDLKDKILGTKAHIVIKSAEGDHLSGANRVAETSRDYDEVVGAAPFIESEVMVSSPTNLGGVVLRGIDPDVVGEVSDLPKNMLPDRGRLEYLEDPKPLLDKLEREEERAKKELREKFEAEKAAFEKEKKALEEAQREKGAAEDTSVKSADTPDPSDEANGEADGDEKVGEMRPIFDDMDGGGDSDDSNGEDAAEETGEMAPMFDEEPDADDAVTKELPGIVVGNELAKSLQVELGDEVNVVTPEGEMGPTGPMPRSRPFRVVGVFKSGMYEYDANYGYTTYEDAKSFLNVSGATGIELKTVDPSVALDVSTRLQKQLGSEYEVLDWQEMNRSLFFALELEKIAMFIVLTFIILVASFSIIAMLIMIVIEKAREIAILKSMGVTNWGVMKIFIFQGVVIGTIGAAIGLVLGLAICAYLKVFGVPLDSEVYYITELPVQINTVEVAAVVLCAMLISFVATIYPSYLAAKLEPVEGLRYE